MTDWYCPWCEQTLTKFEAFVHPHDQYRALNIWRVES